MRYVMNRSSESSRLVRAGAAALVAAGILLADLDRAQAQLPEAPPAPAADTVQQGREAPGDTVEATERVLVPFAYYTPETRIAVGGVAGFYRRLEPQLPLSSLVGSVTGTTRKQFSTELRLEGFLPRGRWVQGGLELRQFPDRFFGVGPGTPDDAEEAYTSRIAVADARVQRSVAGDLRAGLQLRFRWEEVIKMEEDGLLASGTLTASEGGRWMGVGVVATLDSRDDLLYPRTGGYGEVLGLVWPEALGSSTGYREGLVDVRRYVPLRESSALAFRVTAEAAGGDVPALLHPRLGGSRRLRGYYEGRLRDRALASAQAEVRFPVRGRLGAALFAEAGQVAPRFGDLALSDPEYAVGGGLRFRVTRGGVRLRVDYATGRRGSGVYMTVGEAF
jgi:outer membrane protein assembly factor BamA